MSGLHIFTSKMFTSFEESNSVPLKKERKRFGRALCRGVACGYVMSDLMMIKIIVNYADDDDAS